MPTENLLSFPSDAIIPWNLMQMDVEPEPLEWIE